MNPATDTFNRLFSQLEEAVSDLKHFIEDQANREEIAIKALKLQELHTQLQDFIDVCYFPEDIDQIPF